MLPRRLILLSAVLLPVKAITTVKLIMHIRQLSSLRDNPLYRTISRPLISLAFGAVWLISLSILSFYQAAPSALDMLCPYQCILCH
jgi:hypothetical protein